MRKFYVGFNTYSRTQALPGDLMESFQIYADS